MTRTLSLLIAVLVLAAPHRLLAGGEVQRGLAVGSPKLGRAIPYTLYLPRAAGTIGSLPVLYLLHGRGDDETAWLEKGRIAEILDAGMADKTIAPMIVVMPAAGDSWYVDDARDAGFGPVATAFVTDFVEGVEAALPGPERCREARAVGGLSMGGYGALILASERPQLFSNVISLSGSIFSDAADDMQRRGQVYERLYDGVHGAPFSPARFLAWNVFRRLDRGDFRQRPPAVWLAAGDRDYPSILAGTVRLHSELTRRSVSSELHVLPGDHAWALWQAAIAPALAWLSARLDPTCGRSR